VEEHPSAEDLRRFVEGRLDRDEARRVVAHFLEGCRTCGDEAVRYNLLRLSVREQGMPVFNNHPPEMDHVLLTVMQDQGRAPRRAQ
jgi:anti-sigma factor ChrR (cupin superfamily)